MTKAAVARAGLLLSAFTANIRRMNPQESRQKRERDDCSDVDGQRRAMTELLRKHSRIKDRQKDRYGHQRRERRPLLTQQKYESDDNDHKIS